MAFTNTRDVIGDQATLDGLVARTLSEFRENGVDSFSSYALMNNTGLINIEMPGLSSGVHGAQVFDGCLNLTYAAFPDMKSIGQSMFNSCAKLETVSAPNITTIGDNAFRSCITLHSVAFPNASNINDGAFTNCCALMNVSLHSVNNIIGSVFYNVPAGKLEFPLVTNVSKSFANLACEIDFSAKVKVLASAFISNRNLLSIVLRNASMCTLSNPNALEDTPIASGIGHIFVPSNLVDTYKSGTNWATYATQIVSLDEYPKEINYGETITDSWSDIFAAEENGTYTSKYSVGDTKVVNIGRYPVIMQIIAMDTDELADNTGNAKITWLSLHLPFVASIDVNNINNGGWENCGLRSGLMKSIYDNMDSTVKAAVKTVKKTFCDYDTQMTKTVNDNVWIPSMRELFGSNKSDIETSGCTYTGFFASAESKIKKQGLVGATYKISWWLRSAYYYNNSVFWTIKDNGYDSRSNTFKNEMYGVAFGFCT